jgi:hypothetical protein
VTVARYRTPSGADIDLRGIRPDMACTPPLLGASRATRSRDPPVLSAEAPAPGELGLELLGGDPAAELLSGAEFDRCLLTAVSALADPAALLEATAGTVVAGAP